LAYSRLQKFKQIVNTCNFLAGVFLVKTRVIVKKDFIRQNYFVTTMVATRSQKLSYTEYLQYRDETDYRYEFDNGELIFEGQIVNRDLLTQHKIQEQILQGFPQTVHQEIAWQLCQSFNQEIDRNGQDWIARPGLIGVPTTPNKTRIPDICVCEREQWQEIRNGAAILQDTPLLVVEVVSEGTRSIDYRYKLAEYQAIAIPEYWIIDFLAPKVTILQWEAGLFLTEEFVSDEAQISSSIFPEFALTVAEILNV
jgi:Uma2 family endonuclease